MPNEQVIDLLFDETKMKKQQSAVLKLIEEYNKAVQSVKTVQVQIDGSKGSIELAKNLKNLSAIQDDLIKKNMLYASSIKVINESLRQEAIDEKNAAESVKNKIKIDQLLIETQQKRVKLDKEKHALAVQQTKEVERLAALEEKQRKAEEERVKSSTKLTQLEKLEAQLILSKVGSYNRMNVELKIANIQYKALSDSERKAAAGKELLKHLSDLNGKLKEIDSTMGNHQREVGNYQKAFHGLGENLKETILQFVGFYTAFEGVKKFFELSIERAQEAEQATILLKNAFDNAGRTDLFEKFNEDAEKFANTFKRIKPEDIKQVFTKLVDYGKLSETQIQSLTQVIIDYAAKQRISLPEATDVMTKALEGNSRGLKIYGINVKDATSVTERYGLIMSGLAPKVKGAELALEKSSKGGWEVIKESIGRAAESVGNFVIKLFEAKKSSDELFDEAKRKTDSYESSLKPLLARYDELKSKTTLNKDEQTELHGIIQKIVQIVPDAATEFDKYGQALDINKDKVGEFIKVQKGILAQKEFEAVEQNYKKITDRINTIIGMTETMKRGFTTRTVGKADTEVKTALTEEDRKEFLSQIIGFKEEAVNTADLLKSKYGKELPASLAGTIEQFRELLTGVKKIDEKLDDHKVIGNGDPDADPAAKKAREEAAKKAAELLQASFDRANEFRKKAQEELGKYGETKLKILQDQYKNEYNDESKSLVDRLESLQNYYDVSLTIINKGKQNKIDSINEEKNSLIKKAGSEKEKVEIIKLAKAKELNVIVDANREIEKSQLDFTNDVFKINKEANTKNEKETLDHIEKLKKANDERVQAMTDSVDISKNKDIIKTLAEYSIKIGKAKGEEKIKLEKDLQKELLKIESASSLARLMILEKELRIQAAAIQLLGGSTINIEKLITDNLKQQAEIRKGIRDGEYNDANSKRDEMLDKALRYEEAADKLASALINRRYTNEKNRIQETIEANDKKATKDIENINNSLLTDQEKADKIAVIEQVNQSRKEQLEFKQRQLDIQRAKFEKANSILQLIAATAVAVMKHGGPTSPLGLTDLAFGLFQLATIVATPIPKFKEGLDYDYEGPGFINDGGKREVIVRADGSIEFPQKMNYVEHFNKGDRVLPDADLLMNSLYSASMSDMLVGYSDKQSEIDNMTNKLARRLGDVTKAIEDKPVGFVNITRDGFEWGITTAVGRKTMLNGHINF